MPDHVTAIPPTRLRGVNLGGWLVLEKWMTPSLFEGLAATDETTWCAELGGDAPTRLRSHWERFITREDFAWLAGVGINAVRIPLGHWIFGPPYPYHPKYGADPHPFVDGGIDVLDRALGWAAEFGLGVILDLHAAPGCQNGFDNGGIKDVCQWHTREQYLAHSVAVLGRLAARYRRARALYAYPGAQRTALGCAHETAQGVLPARLRCDPRPLPGATRGGRFSRRLPFAPRVPGLHAAAGSMKNVIFDVHRYQCFERADLDMDIHGHLHKAGDRWRQEAEDIRCGVGAARHRGRMEPGAGS